MAGICVYQRKPSNMKDWKQFSKMAETISRKRRLVSREPQLNFCGLVSRTYAKVIIEY